MRIVSGLLLAVALCIPAPAQFETRDTNATLLYPESVALGDFNHDGKLDMAIAAPVNSTQVYVFLGNGDGTFQPATNYSAGTGPTSLVAADFNKDGNLDLAVADYATAGK